MISMLNGINRKFPMTDENGIDVGQDYGSMLDLGGGGQQQLERPTYGQAFRAGYGQTQGGLGRKFLGGLSGYSGGGGFMGGLGNVAKFLI